MKTSQEEVLLRLATAARSNGLELLLELVPSSVGAMTDDTNASIMKRLYQIGLRPDWWKLEPHGSDAAWSAVAEVIDHFDPWCRGIVLLGKGASMNDLGMTFKSAAKHRHIKGFAVGRTIFAEAARTWLGNQIDDDQAIAEMTEKYRALCSAWNDACTDKD